jgi:hypothetical protein
MAMGHTVLDCVERLGAIQKGVVVPSTTVVGVGQRGYRWPGFIRRKWVVLPPSTHCLDPVCWVAVSRNPTYAATSYSLTCANGERQGVHPDG